MRTIQSDNKLMSILKVSSISRLICGTSLGDLYLRLDKGSMEYQFTLDSVPLPKDLNKEVMELLFSTPKGLDPNTEWPLMTDGIRTGESINIPILDKRKHVKGSFTKEPYAFTVEDVQDYVPDTELSKNMPAGKYKIKEIQDKANKKKGVKSKKKSK